MASPSSSSHGLPDSDPFFFSPYPENPLTNIRDGEKETLFKLNGREGTGLTLLAPKSAFPHLSPTYSFRDQLLPDGTRALE